MLRGIDVSSLVDWASLKATHELSFGFARCQRQYGQKDVAFDENMARMHALPGFVAGGYEFALPTKDASGAPLTTLPDPAERARNSWQWFSGASPTAVDLYCLDLETSPVGQDETNAWARAWYGEWSRLADRPPGLYGPYMYMLSRTFAGLRELGFAWYWFPRYYTNTSLLQWPTTYDPQPLGTTWEAAGVVPPEFWQWVDDQTLDIDGDVFDGTLDDLKRLNMALTPADINLFLDTELTRVTPVTKADGTLDTTITIRDVLRYTYDRATKSYTLDTNQAKALAALPDAIAALADPDEVKAAVAEVVAPLRTLLPGE